jgi:hypothetical protein
VSDHRDDLIEHMILPACRLVAAVQDRDTEQVAAIVERLSLLEMRALVVVLAELVPADDPALSLFTTWKIQDDDLALALPPVTPEQAEENRRRLEVEVAEYEHAKRTAA